MIYSKVAGLIYCGGLSVFIYASGDIEVSVTLLNATVASAATPRFSNSVAVLPSVWRRRRIGEGSIREVSA